MGVYHAVLYREGVLPRGLLTASPIVVARGGGGSGRARGDQQSGPGRRILVEGGPPISANTTTDIQRPAAFPPLELGRVVFPHNVGAGGNNVAPGSQTTLPMPSLQEQRFGATPFFPDDSSGTGSSGGQQLSSGGRFPPFGTRIPPGRGINDLSSDGSSGGGFQFGYVSSASSTSEKREDDETRRVRLTKSRDRATRFHGGARGAGGKKPILHVPKRKARPEALTPLQDAHLDDVDDVDEDHV